MVEDRILLVFKARHEFLRGNILQHMERRLFLNFLNCKKTIYKQLRLRCFKTIGSYLRSWRLFSFQHLCSIFTDDHSNNLIVKYSVLLLSNILINGEQRMEPFSGTLKNSDRRAFGPCPAIWSEAFKVSTTERYYRLHGTENLSTKC